MGFDAEYSYVPSSIQTKPDFYAHVLANLKSLLQETSDGGMQLKTNWVSALSSVASVLYNSYADFAGYGSANRVNWAGFYITPMLFPASTTVTALEDDNPAELLVGPYHGRPGCLRIPLRLKRKGVCADAFLRQATVAVNDVHSVSGHIACDGTTASEIVVPIILGPSKHGHKGTAIGVLDIDCQAANVWTQEDIDGLQSIIRWLSGADSPIKWASEGPGA